MAAPINQYRTISLESKRANVVTVHQRAIPTATMAVLLDRFYLDYLLITKDKDGNEGFIGLVLLGGANYLMHNPDRLGSVTVKMPMGVCVSFKDAGLNTLGESGAVQNITVANLAEFIIEPFTSKSAFFVNGSYGVQFNPDGLGWTNVDYGYLGMNETATSIVKNIAENLDYGQVVQVRSYHLNAEGLFTSGVIKTATVAAGRIDVYYTTMNASQATAPTVPRWYTTRGLLTGNLYSNSDATTLATDGYYVDPVGTSSRYWYEVVSGQVIRRGSAVPGGWPSGDPANYATVSWTAKTNLESGICSAQTTSITTYKSYLDNKHYSNPQLTVIVEDGFYARGTGSARTYVQITNGVEGSTYSCGIE